jgi:hypothetical protein
MMSPGGVVRECGPVNVVHGGGGGIRTHEALSSLAVFKTAGFNRSPTPPRLNTRNIVTWRRSSPLIQSRSRSGAASMRPDRHAMCNPLPTGVRVQMKPGDCSTKVL